MRRLIAIAGLSVMLETAIAVPTSETSTISEMMAMLEIVRDAGEKCVIEIKSNNHLADACREHWEVMMTFVRDTKKLPKGAINESPEENRYLMLRSEIGHSYDYITQWIKLHPNQKHNLNYDVIEQAIQHRSAKPVAEN